IEIGNHSHSHYILSKLRDLELAEDLQVSHKLLVSLMGTNPECFAYPFGLPVEHFNEQCLTALRTTGSYPYVFSATDTNIGNSNRENIARICLDKVNTREVIETVARVTPRALKNWILRNEISR